MLSSEVEIWIIGPIYLAIRGFALVSFLGYVIIAAQLIQEKVLETTNSNCLPEGIDPRSFEGMRLRIDSSDLDCVETALVDVFGSAIYMDRRRNDVEHTLHAIRSAFYDPYSPNSPTVPVNMTWADVHEAVTAGGHRFCSLAKDRWSCMGDRYVEKLMETPIFNIDRFGLHRLPNDSTILVEGNSYIAEVFTYWICESSEAELWVVKRRLDEESPIDYFARVRQVELDGSVTIARLLLLSNEPDYNKYPHITVKLLEEAYLLPDVIVLGWFNGVFGATQQSRRNVYPHHFKGVQFITRPYTFLPDNCGADFMNCVEGRGHHQCLPGPMAREAEKLMAEILQALSLKSNSTQRVGQ